MSGTKPEATSSMTVSMSFRVLMNVLNVISVFEGKLIQVKFLTVEDLLQGPVV